MTGIEKTRGLTGVHTEQAKGVLLQRSGAVAEAVQGTDRPSSPACVLLVSAIHVQYVIARALRLSGSADDELAVRVEIG
jgi:hypothetical protein